MLRKTVQFVFFGREIQTLEINPYLYDARYAVSDQILCEQDIDGNGDVRKRATNVFVVNRRLCGDYEISLSDVTDRRRVALFI